MFKSLRGPNKRKACLFKRKVSRLIAPYVVSGMIQFESKFLTLDGISGSQRWAAGVTTMELAGNFSASRESEHTIILYNVL